MVHSLAFSQRSIIYKKYPAVEKRCSFGCLLVCWVRRNMAGCATVVLAVVLAVLLFAGSGNANVDAGKRKRKPDVVYLRPGTTIKGEKLFLDSGKRARIFCYNGERAFLTRFHRAWDDIIFEVEFNDDSPPSDRSLIALSQDRFSFREVKDSLLRVMGMKNASSSSPPKKPSIVSLLRAAERPSYAHRIVWSLSALLWRAAWMRDHSSMRTKCCCSSTFPRSKSRACAYLNPNISATSNARA